jgi:hypothetical protein
MMLDRTLQESALDFAEAGWTIRSTSLPNGTRRYRFRRVRLERVVIRSGSEAETVTADLQAGESLLVGDAGVEWRASGDRAVGGWESRFWPWSAVLELYGETAVLLEERDPDEIELERAANGTPWDEMDRYAEDWQPTQPTEELGLPSDVAIGVLDALQAAPVLEEEVADA